MSRANRVIYDLRITIDDLKNCHREQLQHSPFCYGLVKSCRLFCKNSITTLMPLSVLETIDFGLGAAQQEKQLRTYFYRSGSFKLACSDKTYLVLGAKGAGKSAIFRMLQELHGEISIFQP